MAKNKAADAASDADERADDPLHSARETFETARDAVEDGLDEAHLYLKRQWRERPLTVAGAALGVGLLLGLLLSGRR